MAFRHQSTNPRRQAIERLVPAAEEIAGRTRASGDGLNVVRCSVAKLRSGACRRAKAAGRTKRLSSLSSRCFQDINLWVH